MRHLWWEKCQNELFSIRVCALAERVRGESATARKGSWVRRSLWTVGLHNLVMLGGGFMKNFLLLDKAWNELDSVTCFTQKGGLTCGYQ